MKIFLSAVSKQFRSCRDALRSDLSAVGADVVVQEDFTQHPGTLLAKLEELVAGCDRVIALVGDCYGFDLILPRCLPVHPVGLTASGSTSSLWASGEMVRPHIPSRHSSTSPRLNSWR